MKGDLDGALQLFEAMVAKGVKADTVNHLMFRRYFLAANASFD